MGTPALGTVIEPESGFEPDVNTVPRFATVSLIAGAREPTMTVTDSSDRIEVVFGRRYTTKILIALLDHGQPMRFTEIFYAVPGLSKRLLTELEETGMVQRDVYPGKPVTITYRLSEAGTGLQAALSEIRRWADQQPA